MSPGNRLQFTLSVTYRSCLVMLIACALSRCSLPPGCGPGDVPANPLSSNLVDYTKPASGSILFKEDFTLLKVKFLRQINKASFQVEDDMRMFEIRHFWDPDREENPFPGDVSSVFSLAPWTCPGPTCDRLELVVDSSSLEPLRHYRIRFLGEEPGGPGNTPSSLISSPSEDGDVVLTNDVDVLIGIGFDPHGIIEQPELHAPTRFLNESCYDVESSEFDPERCYVEPHTFLLFTCTTTMGYVGFTASPLMGLNVGYSTEELLDREYTFIWSDSRQGLLPGEHYTMDFPSGDLPEWMGIPRTTDRWGNPLKESVHVEFNTSHVRITAPVHKPEFGPVREPDPWYKLGGYSPETPFFVAEATKFAALLKSTGPDNSQGDVVFEPVPLPSDREDNSFHTISVSDITRGSPGCPTTLEVHAYDEDGGYLGADKMDMYAYPPAERIKIVTYNADTHDSNAGYSWRERLSNFARDVVAPYQPAIIAVQEVYLDSEGTTPFNGCWSHGEEIDKGDYLHHLVDRINEILDRSDLKCGKYNLATAVHSNHALKGDCEEWEGHAIIYDSQQVGFIYPEPRPGADEWYGCNEWDQGQQDLYEIQPWGSVYNDCMPESNTDYAQVARAVFEFPLHSNRYFSLYNTHQEIPPCRIPDSIRYIQDRQETFRDDLEGYLGGIDEPFWIYPPVFAGDMNWRGFTEENEDADALMDECNVTDEGERQEARDLMYSFEDAPGRGKIDKVLVGKPGDWIRDVELEIVEPPPEEEMPSEICRQEIYPPFSCFPLGYYMEGVDNAYSDHSPSMVEIEAVDD